MQVIWLNLVAAVSNTLVQFDMLLHLVLQTHFLTCRGLRCSDLG